MRHKGMVVNYYEKVKSWLDTNKNDLFTAALIFLVGLGSFGLGRLSAIWPDKQPIRIINRSPLDDGVSTGDTGRNPQMAAIAAEVKGKFVASKNGKYYHFPWCPGALRIKGSNKVWFQTKEAAEARGYKPAGNCPGL
jgi:hypothetical protein